MSIHKLIRSAQRATAHAVPRTATTSPAPQTLAAASCRPGPCLATRPITAALITTVAAALTTVCPSVSFPGRRGGDDPLQLSSKEQERETGSQQQAGGRHPG